MKSKLYIILLFTSVATLTISRLSAQSSMMGDVSYTYMEKLVETARANYPQVKVKQQQVKIANTAYQQSKIAWFDALSFTYIYTPQNTNTATTNGFSGFQPAVSLNVGTLIRNPYIIKNSKEAVKVAELEQQTYDLSIEAQVKQRYITYLQQQAILRLRTNSAQEAEGVVTVARHQFEKGTETLENYNKALIVQLDNAQLKITAESAALIAKTALEELLGKKLEDIK